jgi:hypothetical protein
MTMADISCNVQSDLQSESECFAVPTLAIR